MERGKRIKINPVDDASNLNNVDQLIYISSASEKYSEFIKEVRKHPYKLYEYYTGLKLPLCQRIWFDTIGKLKKTSYEKGLNDIDNVIKQYVK